MKHLFLFMGLLALSMTGCGSGLTEVVSSQSTTSDSSSVSGGSSGGNVGTMAWKAPGVGSTNSLGTVNFVKSNGATSALLYPTITAVAGSMTCTSATWDSSGTTLTLTFSQPLGTVHVAVHVNVTSLGLDAQVSADQPTISAVSSGYFASAQQPVPVSVPYYNGWVYSLNSLGAFGSAWWDWHADNATSLVSVSAQYQPKTDGTRNLLREHLYLTVSSNVDDVLPSPNNAASPYMAELAGKTVLDIWDDGFAEIGQNLAELGTYGLNNCAAIIHTWQGQGFDNALPDQYPANTTWGGSAGVTAMIAEGKQAGCLMALHENYVDYYPNYPQYTAAAVGRNTDGSFIKSYYNTSTKVQSYSMKPTQMLKYAATQTPLIHQNYMTNAGYVDVNSSATVSTHGDQDATSGGAGKLTSWFNETAALWAYERQVQGGPVFGEGENHWQYSGLLDGVEAQLGAGFNMNLGAALPLFVDFDLLRIHPLQINHGMGYYERWTPTGVAMMTTTNQDAYRTQEVAYGHAPFLSRATWNNVWNSFQEADLVGPVAKSYGTAHANGILYGVNGTWTNSSAAVRANQFTQVQVNYDNGLSVVANTSQTPLTWNGVTIPQYGWAAASSNLLAYTGACSTVICDFAWTPTSLFANARSQADYTESQGYAKPGIASVTEGSFGAISLNYTWQIYRSPGANTNYQVFVHFINEDTTVNPTAAVTFQQEYWPTPPTSTWKAGSYTIEPITSFLHSVPDGVYSVRVGLYDPVSGVRLPLVGENDGTSRYIVGDLTISGGGTKFAFTHETLTQVPDPRLNTAGLVLNFEKAQTDGMFSMDQENGNWVLRPYPRDRNFTILLNSSDYPEPNYVQTSNGGTVEPTQKGGYWQLPLNGSSSYSWMASSH